MSLDLMTADERDRIARRHVTDTALWAEYRGDAERFWATVAATAAAEAEEGGLVRGAVNFG